MPRAYLGLGSNQGDRLAELRRAVHLLAQRGISLRRASSVYETAPVGFTGQSPFFNAVIEVETDLAPADLLAATRAVEEAAGRTRTLRWGPRTLDVDILLYDDARVDLPELTIPHPRLHQRRFALLPLLEIDPDADIPGIGPARACLGALDPAEQAVTRVGDWVAG